MNRLRSTYTDTPLARSPLARSPLSCSLRIWGAFAGDRRSRRFAGSGAAVVAFAAVAALLALAPGAGVAAEHNTVVKRFTNGTSHNSVGIVDASEDAQEDGPQAIYAADDGGLYLLDQVNGRILRFDAKAPGGAVQSLELPQEMRPTDIVVRRGNIYVWDGAPRALLPTGRDDAPVRGLTQTRAPDAPDNFTLSAFAQMGSQPLDSPAELLADPNGDHTRALPVPKKPARQFVATRGHGSVYADVVASEKRGNAEVDVREQDTNIPIATLRLQVRDRIGVVEFLEIDNTGRMFVLTENIPNNAKRTASVFVARFSPEGALESIYDIPLDEEVAISRRFIAITPDGDVYFLRSRKGEVDVVGVGSRNVRPSAIIENPGLRLTDRETRITGKGPIAAVRPLTRQQVVQNAIGFESVQWRLAPANYGADPDTACTGFNRIRRPGYLSGKLNQEVRGVPYCWGCMGSLNAFRSRIANGVLAGNVCTHNDPRPDVAGVDCSAFVSAAWGLNTHVTTAVMPAFTTALSNAWDLQPGDALNKPGSHVMLFLRFTADRKAEVMESSTGGCNGRVCRNVYPLASLLARGFKPVRYKALEDEPAVAGKPNQTQAGVRR